MMPVALPIPAFDVSGLAGGLAGVLDLSPVSSLLVGPVQFDAPIWLFLIPLLGVVALLMGARSLSGLGPVTKWVAMGARLLVISVLAAALAEPQWRRESKDVSVMVVVDASESVPQRMQDDVTTYLRESIETSKKADDRLGVVAAAKNAFIQSLPTKLNTEPDRQSVGAIDGTNLAAALRLAIAVMPKDAANRIVLATDGNETVGNLLQAAETAKALKVPVDVLPLKYKYTNEVMVDRLVAPAAARDGENLSLRVVLKAVSNARGRLVILMNGETVTSEMVDLKPGLNVLSQTVTAQRTGPQKFEAVFEPLTEGGRVVGDEVEENNRGQSVTFVSGEGRVLVLTETEQEAAALLRVMTEAKIKGEVRPSGDAPQSLTDWNAFDAVMLVNQESYGFSQKQQEELRQYIHDTGGGLVMIGGPDSYGAGGWIGSPLEDALPVKLDPPQKRQMPRGALALVMHSVEMPEGVFFGKKVCEHAVNALSRLDLAGIIEYGWNGGTEWVHPLAPVGDGSAIKRSIQKLMFGDMPDFSPSLELALAGLSAAEAGQRHVIMISDGDPSVPSSALLDKYLEKRITISTVGVFPHSGGGTSAMRWISKYTGGRHYHIDTQKGLATLPQIFIKEAQTVRRSLIWEGPAFQPSVVGLSETMRGIGGSVPPLSGYVVTAEREGLSLVTLKGKEGDPILAQWQYGLGKVVAYTSDATTRWNSSWVEWSQFRAFWEQHLRWAMRPGGSANVKVITENKGDQTVITVEALDKAGERLNFAQFKGRLAAPDGTGIDVNLSQAGPGRYQATVPTANAGSYVLSLRYAAPDTTQEDGVMEGSVQAAVNRPFADEYRTLEDNTPLLAQVAAITGGRVLEGNPKTDELWSREGLTMPVSRRAIWLYVALAGLTLFLVDVGVRRVRIDIPAIAGWVAGLFGRSAVKSGTQLGNLRAAREQAQKKMGERLSGASLTPEQLTQEAKLAAQKATQEAARGRETSKAKFEATPDQLKRNKSDIAMGGADVKPEAIKPKPRPVDGGAAQQPGEGMSRLMQAKKKAQQEMGDEHSR